MHSEITQQPAEQLAEDEETVYQVIEYLEHRYQPSFVQVYGSFDDTFVVTTIEV